MNISDGSDLIVRQANDLIESLYRLPTLSEERIIRLLISQIKPSDEDFKTYRIKVEDFAEIFGIKETSGRLYEQVDRATEALTKRNLNIRMGKSYLHVNWLSSALYVHGSGYVDLRFDPYLKPFLLHLNGYYTKYQIIQIAHFQSRYSIRIYELLKMETFKTPVNGIFKKLFEYSELRAMLGIQESEYKRVNDFKKDVLDVAVREINGRSDIYITNVIGVKPSRKIEYWEFHFQNSKQGRLSIDPPPPQLQEVKDHPDDVKQLIAFGISEETAYTWRKKYGVARIIRNLGFVTAKKSAGKVKEDLAGYVASAIAKDYAKGWEDKAKQAEEKAKINEAEEAKKREAQRLKEEDLNNSILSVIAHFEALPDSEKSTFTLDFYETLNNMEKPMLKKHGYSHVSMRLKFARFANEKYKFIDSKALN
jgi:hypothetical protein